MHGRVNVMVSTVGNLSSLASGVCSFNPGSHTFFHELSVTGERMNTEYWLTAMVKPAQEKCG